MFCCDGEEQICWSGRVLVGEGCECICVIFYFCYVLFLKFIQMLMESMAHFRVVYIGHNLHPISSCIFIQAHTSFMNNKLIRPALDN